MSKLYSAHQFDAPFKPHRLANWEALESQRFVSAGLPARSGRTEFIVDERGHLLPGKPKRSASFVKELPVFAHSPARWPEPNPVHNLGSAATMGYKGIPTSYLPSSTVKLPTVVIPGCKERRFE